MKIHGDELFRSFKHGFRILSHNLQSVTSSGFQFSLASSILSIAALIFALQDGRGRRSFNNLLLSLSSSSFSERESSPVVPGLQNLGNNCFLNVILQALASCSCFRSSLQRIVEEFEASSEDEPNVDMPLAVSLNTLLQELCITRHGREILSPRKVMLAMAHYTPNFNLTRQQDAEEALAYMLSSLREECSICYAPDHNSLAVATTLSSCRIVTPKRRIIYNELERWTRSFVGPFNGVVGSILSCRSCSFQISLDFQFFNCLYLSPATYGGGSIMPGCSVEDCLRQFFVAERLESYFCSHCWHIAALKFLYLLNKNETDIEKLQSCSKQDTCNCKSIPSLHALPWSNSYSRTFKQLHIARSPKILCLNLQRASMNVFGELVKIQGHISFPLTLNMSPFLNNGVEVTHFDQNMPIGQLMKPYQQHARDSNFVGVQNDTSPLNCVCIGEKGNLTETYTIGHQNSEVAGTSYTLVSVVEHFGSIGSGHYTVYRRIKNTNLEKERSEFSWVGVSDSQVHGVSEEDVLASSASLLFYERVSVSQELLKRTA